MKINKNDRSNTFSSNCHRHKHVNGLFPIPTEDLKIALIFTSPQIEIYCDEI